MITIKTQILKIVDTNQPGFVECLLVDAWGYHHTFVEKIPIVSCDDIWVDSEFPTDGEIRCEVVKEWIDDSGRKIITVSTEFPDDVETTDGINKFDLLPNQLLEI